MNNQEFKARPQLINVNSRELIVDLFPFSIKTSKCISNKFKCNNINNPYAKLCVADVVKNLNVKVFNLMSRTNEKKKQSGMKLLNVNVDLIAVLAIINNAEMMINVDVNTTN